MVNVAKYVLELTTASQRWKDSPKTTVVGSALKLIDARKKAVAILTKNDVKGQLIWIMKDGTWAGTVSMQTDADVYVKPSVGLKNGINFMWDDISNFYTCYRDGSVKKW